MISFKRIADKFRSKYISWKGHARMARGDWLDASEENEEYYHNNVDGTGTLFTQAQLDVIAENTDIPVSVNWIHSTGQQKLALLTQAKPSMRVVSLDGRAKQHSLVLDKIKHAVLYHSEAQTEIKNMAKDMLISGQGNIMVTEADYYTRGIFNVKVTHIPYDEVILDINAKKETLDDMEGFFIEKKLSLDKFTILYGDLVGQIIGEDGRPVDVQTFVGDTWVESQITEKVDVTTTTWDSDPTVIVREYYEKTWTTMYTVMSPTTGRADYLFAENLDEMSQAILAHAQDKIRGVYIKRTLFFGDFEVWNEVKPITSFPLKTSFYEWGGRPYNSFGMIHYEKDKQKAYDKVMSTMILNGILQNNAGWNAPVGSIPDRERANWENHANNPKSLKEWVPIVRENQVFKPEKDTIQPLSNFYPMLLDMLKQGIEYSTGITPILQGNAQDTGVEVFSSLQQYQSAAMMRVLMATTSLNNTLKRLGNTLIEMVVANIQPQDYQFFDEKGKLAELTLTQEVINSIRQFRYQMLSVPSTAMPTQRLAAGQELMKIAQSSPDPAERSLYTQTAMELSDIREFDDVKEQLDVVKNAQAQLSQLQEAYNRLLETSKQMENKVINVSIENRILKAIEKGDKDIAVATEKAKGDINVAKELEKGKIQGEQKVQK